MKGQGDEFIWVLLAGVLLLVILAVGWGSLSATQLKVVEPEHVRFIMAPGDTRVFKIVFNGTGEDVTITAIGEIDDWIDFERRNFDVKGVYEVSAFITVPKNVESGWYSGDILIETLGFSHKIPVTINVTRFSGFSKRYIELGDFTVSYAFGEEVVERRRDAVVEKGYFSEKKYSFAAIIEGGKEEMVVSSYIRMIIDSTNEKGDLLLLFNGKEIYRGTPGIGEIIIDVDPSIVNRSNSVVMAATGPGLCFWDKTYYYIRKIEFVVNLNGSRFVTKRFVLRPYEVLNFKGGKVKFRLGDFDVERLNDLMININGVEIFKGIPSSYTSVPFGGETNLLIGENEIEFSVEPGTFYRLENAVLEITYYS